MGQGPFGTTNLAAILARITRGLQLAIALEERLARRATRGQDIRPSAWRMPSLGMSGSQRARRVKPDAAPQAAPEDIVALPTPQEIAALLRRRPVGAVLADICRDFGIRPGDVEPELWWELQHTIIEYGGNFAAYFIALSNRMFGVAKPRAQLASPQSPAPIRFAAATGPP